MSFATLSFRATDADEYEHFMARWSRRLAGPFLDFVGGQSGASGYSMLDAARG